MIGFKEIWKVNVGQNTTKIVNGFFTALNLEIEAQPFFRSESLIYLNLK